MKRESRAAGLVCALAVVAFAPAMARAPPERVTLDELRAQLWRGDQIALVQADGRSLWGRFTRIDQDVLQVMIATMDGKGNASEREMVVPFRDLQWLERRKDSVKNSVLIGASWEPPPVLGISSIASSSIPGRH